MSVLASWSRPIAAGLALAVGLLGLAAPADARQAPRPAGQSTLVASAEARLAGSGDLAVAAQSAAAPAPAEASRGFFKTKKGAVVLVLLGGVTVWTAISRKQDAIHSPGR